MVTPKLRQQKKKINKLDYNKIRIFCASKDTIRLKMQPMEWGEFANNMSVLG